MLFDYPVWAFLGSWMELIKLILVPDLPYYSGVWLLHHMTHNFWNHYQSLCLATNHTLVHMPTCYIQKLLFRSLFWSLQSIYQKDCFPIVLPWWQILCPPHLYFCGAPWWMISFTSWTPITSLLFQAFLDPHKKASDEANMRLVYSYLGLCMVPFKNVLISGISRIFCLCSFVSLLSQGRLCKIPSQYCLFCLDPCVSDYFQRQGI